MYVFHVRFMKVLIHDIHTGGILVFWYSSILVDCDPVLSDLNLTASKMASDGAPALVCWVTFMEIILLIISCFLFRLKQNITFLKKNIKEGCLVRVIGCFVLVG